MVLYVHSFTFGVYKDERPPPKLLVLEYRCITEGGVELISLFNEYLLAKWKR